MALAMSLKYTQVALLVSAPCQKAKALIKLQIISIILKETRGDQVDVHEVRGTNNGIGSSVSILVPTVCGADLDALGKLGLDFADLVLEFFAREVATVEGLGTDGHAVDAVGILAGDIDDGFGIRFERGFDIRPVMPQIISTASWEPSD